MMLTRTRRVGPREYAGCHVCLQAAHVNVQVSRTGRAYWTAGGLCTEHNTAEEREVLASLAATVLEGDER
jgi:hypothetical protein